MQDEQTQQIAICHNRCHQIGLHLEGLQLLQMAVGEVRLLDISSGLNSALAVLLHIALGKARILDLLVQCRGPSHCDRLSHNRSLPLVIEQKHDGAINIQHLLNFLHHCFKYLLPIDRDPHLGNHAVELAFTLDQVFLLLQQFSLRQSIANLSR